MRQFIDFFLSIRDSKFFTGLVISVIVASAIYAGASSYDIPNQYTVILDYFDYAITVFFLVEILIRIFAEANHPLRFFKNGWNIFDFIIVLVSLVPVDGAESAFVARLLRIVRVLRIITVIPAFRHIVESLFKSMPRVAFIALLMFIVIYIWAAIGTLIFSETDPEHWRNIGIAALTLAQVATYDDWAAIMTNVFELSNNLKKNGYSKSTDSEIDALLLSCPITEKNYVVRDLFCDASNNHSLVVRSSCPDFSWEHFSLLDYDGQLETTKPLVPFLLHFLDLERDATAAHVRGASNRSHDLAAGQPVAKDTTQSIADLTMPIPTPSHPRSPDSRSSHLPRQYPAQLAAAAAQQQQWPPKIAPNLGPRGRTTTH